MASLPHLSGHLSGGAIHIFTQDPADLRPCSRKVSSGAQIKTRTLRTGHGAIIGLLSIPVPCCCSLPLGLTLSIGVCEMAWQAPVFDWPFRTSSVSQTAAATASLPHLLKLPMPVSLSLLPEGLVHPWTALLQQWYLMTRSQHMRGRSSGTLSLQ